ncbi:MAG TPA: hypothetical protein VFS43_18385 [Polyangiaceae bacterium]|nr:hypothetical protein [Polyangiaceae bacterium]
MGACGRPRAKGEGQAPAGNGVAGGAEPAPAGADATPCADVLSHEADRYVAWRARERGEADPDAEAPARARYTQCKAAENDGELERAPPKRRGDVREVRAALAEWVGARAGLAGAAGRGDPKARAHATAAALGDVERLIATTLLPGAWRAGGSPGEGAAAAKRTLEGLATPGGEGIDPASYRDAYEGLRRAHARLERAVAPLAPPEAAAVWRFVANLAF